MSLYIDRDYINKISHNLDGFVWKADTANFRCPICGDSQKSQKKKRGGFYPSKEKTHYNMGCFNCGHQSSLCAFLKEFHGGLYQQYLMDAFGFDNNRRWEDKRVQDATTKSVTSKTEQRITDLGLQSVKSLPDGHFCKTYVKMRKIPEDRWDVLFYCEHFQKWVNENIETNKFSNFVDVDARLVIPFYDSNGLPFAFQGRSLDPNVEDRLRYMTICPNKDRILIYGLERIKSYKTFYITEGPIDSLYLPNALSVAGSGLRRVAEIVGSNAVFVYDNEPRSKEILGLMNKTVYNPNNSMVIWPKGFKYKDIGEAIEDGIPLSKVLKILQDNTYKTVLEKKLKFLNWKLI